MHTILIQGVILALLINPALGFNVSVLSLQRRNVTSMAQPQSSEIADIEAYRKMVDSYSKNHPELTRFYVDALAEGKTDSPPKEWYEIKSQSELDDAEEQYATRSIIVSMKEKKIVYVDVGEPEEHSRHDNKYYFRGDGTLAKLSSDYAGSVEGTHIKRERFYNADGKPLRATTQCFNVITTSRGPKESLTSCQRREMRGELRDYEVAVYLKNTDLPGYEILKSR
jgi:hypothetical protein